ncbi:polysaccharide deacetylase [Paenibacillus spiritus]|nr:polysaccharide deacetylase [Paenibacillus spiritus]
MLSWLNVRRRAAAAMSGIILCAVFAGGGGGFSPIPSGPSVVSASGDAKVQAAGGPAAKAADAAKDAGRSEGKPPATASLSAAPASSESAGTGRQQTKTIYLTFDDGPSKVTPDVLNILKREKIKATFFVLGEAAKRHPEWINAIYEQGHTIGNHTYDHTYSTLYSGFPAFWSEIKETEETLRLITGQRPRLVRAPGGTAGHFDDTYFYLMKQAGYLVSDWTVDSGDSLRRGVPAADILSASLAGLGEKRVILLLHDGAGHEASAEALPEIIARYRSAGYMFKTMEDEADTVRFKVHPSASYAKRTPPSAAWIAGHIASNAELFADGRPLVLEVGMMQTTLASGEYTVRDGHYAVPLRAAVERLGGCVSWDAASRTARAEWNGRLLTADPAGGAVRITGKGDPGATAVVLREQNGDGAFMRGDTVWIPLRTLLGGMGHPILETVSGREEQRVKAG